MKHSLLHSLLLPCLTSTLFACGSVATVDSKDVPTKAGSGKGTDSIDKKEAGTEAGTEAKTRPSPGVQDVHQSFGLTFSTEGNKTLAFAQFRVRTAQGDTIRFSNPGQVTFRSVPLSKIDGTTVNTVITLLNHLTVLPIFSFLRTGTFYSDSFPGSASGTFHFADDNDNPSDVAIVLPEVTVGQVPTSLAASAPGAEVLTISVRTKTAHGDANLGCSLSSSAPNAEGHESSTYTNAKAAYAGTNGTCVFSRADMAAHAKSTKPVELKIEFTAHGRGADAFGRGIDTRASWVDLRQLSIK